MPELPTPDIKIAKQLKTMADDEGGDITTANEGYNTMVFLWAVEKGYASAVALSDPPDNEELDSKCNAIRRKLRPAVVASRDPAPEDDLGGDRLQQVLAQNLAALTQQTLAAAQRDERKKSMSSMLTPEAESLFT